VGENIDTIKKNTKGLFDAGKEGGLDVNPEKTNVTLSDERTKVYHTDSK
jgi:hypothetical protein